MTCPAPHRENGRLWITFSVVMVITIVTSIILDRVFGGPPLGFQIPLVQRQATLSNLISSTAVLIVSLYIGYKGVKELVVEREFSVEFLMAIAAISSTLLGYLLEAATILLFYSISEHLEGYVEDRARRTVETLCTYMPDGARVVVNGDEIPTPILEVKLGSIIAVRAGERVPLDGEVTFGTTFVDQSLLTGESSPILKTIGERVFAGTLAKGALNLKVTNEANETLVSRILELVMRSRERKASVERFVDSFARVYVPALIILAAMTIVIPTLLGLDPKTWIYRSLVLLVVSCPSAFIVSVPATLFTAVAVAARKGVVIKGGVYLEALSRIQVVGLDKTGTLTSGALEVSHIEQYGDKKILEYAAALERFSNHAIADAVLRKAAETGLSPNDMQVESVEEIPGQGMTGLVNKHHVVTGNETFLREKYPHYTETLSEVSAHDSHSKIFVSLDGQIGGTLCFSDRVRNDAQLAIRELEAQGIKTVILTGDKREVAREISRQLNVKDVRAELFPEDKLRIIEELRSEYGPVAMVGDGINDAPALAASDVGIAMGGSRSGAALESADVILVRDELGRLPYLVRLSRLAMRIVKENVAISMGAKIIIGILGLLGAVPLWVAVALGDDGVTLLTLLNTLRIPRLRS